MHRNEGIGKADGPAPRADRGARLTLAFALSGLVLGLAGTRLGAEEIQVNAMASTSVRAPELRVEDRRVLLSLDETISLALERNLSLAVERYNQEISRYGILQSEGLFDFVARATLSASDNTTPSASNLDGADVQERDLRVWNLGLDRLVPSGGTASVDWTNSRFESNSTFSTLNPNFTSGVDFSFRQPLLRNRGRLATQRTLRIARTDHAISEEAFRRKVIDTIVAAEESYWTHVENLAQREVAMESLALAKQLHQQNRIRVDVGTLAPLELVQSEVGIATREEEVIVAQAAAEFSADNLRQLLNLDHGELWDWPIQPTTEAAMEAVQVDLSTAIQTALGNRPELQSQRLSQEKLEWDAQYFKNQRLPQLDLSVTYGFNGVGGPVTERDFFTGEVLFEAPGGYGDAIDQITGGEFDGWSAGLTVNVPVQNRTARAQSAIADAAVERGKMQLRELELQVLANVRDTARLVQTASKSLNSARVSSKLAEKNLDAEHKRYDNGMSTSYQVLEIQEDLAAARSREVRALANYRKALVVFQRSTATLLEERGVEVIDS